YLSGQLSGRCQYQRLRRQAIGGNLLKDGQNERGSLAGTRLSLTDTVLTRHGLGNEERLDRGRYFVTDFLQTFERLVAKGKIFESSDNLFCARQTIPPRMRIRGIACGTAQRPILPTRGESRRSTLSDVPHPLPCAADHFVNAALRLL